MKQKTGRMKPCLYCGKEFYCHKYRDVGGTQPEKKYCSVKCDKTHKFHSGMEVDRFWAKVEKAKGNACWQWKGAVTSHGYGCIKFGPNVRSAHQIAYKLCVGEVPDGLIIRHKCDNPLCCNPAHMELGTRKDNAQDKVKRGRTPKHHVKRLTVEQVKEIRAAQGKLSSGEIMKKYRITRSYAFTIWGRRVWRHI